MKSSLTAGSARTIITPPLGTYLIGYADRVEGCTAIHDELAATAVVLDDGRTQLAIVTLDLLALNEHIVARVREKIAQRHPIPSAQVAICCSHTHNGPIAYAGDESKNNERRFIDELQEKLVTLIGKALAGCVPVDVTWGQGQAGIAVNRRQLTADGLMIIGQNPDGPVDRSLLVLHLQPHPPAFGPPTTIVNFACHPTILNPGLNAVSAGWPGVMRREVEAATGGICLFLQGAAGDLNPRHEWADDDLSVMEQFGSAVAREVQRILTERLPLTPTPLKAVQETIWLPIEAERKADGTILTYQEALATRLGLPATAIDPLLDERYPWRTPTVQRAGQWLVPLEIQAFRLGDCGLVMHSAETFTEIGLAIKEQSPAHVALFAGYSNGCIGYLPTAAAHRLGGYEVEVVPYFYRMPGRLAPDCDRQIVDRSTHLLNSLFQIEDDLGGIHDD